MNKKIKQLAELLEQHIYPYCKYTETPLILKINDYTIVRILSKSVSLESYHFTIHHLDIIVVNPNNILITVPHDFDDTYIDDITVDLIDVYRKNIEPNFTAEARLKVIAEKKRLLELEEKELRNED